MKSKRLTITEMIDFAIQRGVDRSFFPRVTTIIDLIMNDEFMKCVYKAKGSLVYQIRLASGGKVGSDLVRYITDYKEDISLWLSKRVYFVALNDWDKAHQEMSDYIVNMIREKRNNIKSYL